MSDINTTAISGRLGNDSALTYSQSGFAFLKFSVAVKAYRKGKDGEANEATHWIDCKAIGKRAEGLAKVLKKGTFCVVQGELEQETWEDKASGGKRSKLVLFVNSVALGPKPGGGSGLSDRDQGSSGGGAADFDDIPFAPIGDVG